MSGAEGNAADLPVGADVETAEDVRTGRVDGPLYRVVRAQGVLRDVRRVEAATGDLDGIELRFAAAELRPVRPAVARRYEALRARRVLAQWRDAAATDAEDFGIVEELLDSAERLAALVLGDGIADPDAAVAVCGWRSDLDGAHVVQIDTTESTGRVRVFINDGAVYDGDPETDEPPGAHYVGPGWQDGRRLWNVRSLMTGETSTFRASGQADATAQYLDVVSSNLLVWEEPEQAAARCDECGAATDELVSPQHGPTCSLHPDNCVGAPPGRPPVSDQPSGYVSVEDMCWPDPTDPRELAHRLRYSPGGLGRRDELVLASIVEAYSSLVCMDSRTRQRRVMQLREAADVFGRVGGRR